MGDSKGKYYGGRTLTGHKALPVLEIPGRSPPLVRDGGVECVCVCVCVFWGARGSGIGAGFRGIDVLEIKISSRMKIVIQINASLRPLFPLPFSSLARSVPCLFLPLLPY